MKISSLREKTIEKLITKYSMPQAKIVNYETDDIEYFEIDDILPGMSMIPDVVIERDGKSLFGYAKNHNDEEHVLVTGYTGCGKSTRYVVNGIISYLQKGSSVVVTDPSGELFDILYGFLKHKNIESKVLNFVDSFKSNTYNPFYVIALECAKEKQITLNAEINIAKLFEKFMEVPPRAPDPYWVTQARNFMLGCTYVLLEDLIDGKIGVEKINFYNIFLVSKKIREITLSDNTINTKRHPFFKNRINRKSLELLLSITNDAPRTKSNVYSSIDGAVGHLNNLNFFTLTATNEINIEELWQKQQIIFIQNDSSKQGETLSGIFMERLFEQAKKAALNYPRKRLPREIGCFLDEFANINICEPQYFINILTQSRKYGIFFNMFIQDYNQLEEKYHGLAKTIRANTTEVFFSTKDYDTRNQFAESCGKTTMETYESICLNEYPKFCVQNLLTAEKLAKTPTGYVYISRIKNDILYTYYEAFYELSYLKNISLEPVYPKNEATYQRLYYNPLEDVKVENKPMFDF